MRDRYQHQNIPTEILRSVLYVSEAGSITKAAHTLGLSQSAISYQVKRIEQLVGGLIFQKTPGGSSPTDLGKIVLGHAKRILDENDQLLRLKGSSHRVRSLRFGLSNSYVPAILAGPCRSALSNVGVSANTSFEIAKGLSSGFLDVGLFLSSPYQARDPKIYVLYEQDEEVVWIRSQNFVTSPGAPIAVISWPGGVIDDLMIRSLEEAGIAYRVTFSSPDYQSKIAAVEAGLGLTVIPKQLISANVVRTNDYYLPSLVQPKLILGASSAKIDARRLIRAVGVSLFATEEFSEAVAG